MSEERYDMYRFYIINKMPSLSILDGSPITEQERSAAAQRQKELEVVFDPEKEEGENTMKNKKGEPNLDHLPHFVKKNNSEGNRFIKNNEL
eukprot:CAMPEP_0114986756 /NCGR_PEP_ID=MMETSP0216-20121206/8605_1 /TAXON_ID=223996 /ORGANISM="Protocruzia adherens, Strain Boccale" /LENGTH=90 /DNA_ID=CAMNT_0002349231 /DNA_START=139 /DNA_END=411 /DNA_ORIENTATION=-